MAASDLDTTSKHSGNGAAGRARVGVAGLIAAAAIAGCGSAGTAATPPPATTTAPATTASSPPPNVTIALDHTTASSSTAIAGSYEAAALRSAGPILATGGHLRVVVFAGAGVAPAIVIDEDVPAEDELSGNKRKRYLIAARANLAALLKQGLSLSVPKPDPDLATSLSSMKADGSDVTGALLSEVELLKEHRGGALHVMSDGLQRDSQVDFSRTIESSTIDAAVGELAPLMPDDATGIVIAIEGVGLSGNVDNVSTRRSQKLKRVWEAACEATKANDCNVGTSV